MVKVGRPDAGQHPDSELLPPKWVKPKGRFTPQAFQGLEFMSGRPGFVQTFNFCHRNAGWVRHPNGGENLWAFYPINILVAKVGCSDDEAVVQTLNFCHGNAGGVRRR